MKNKNNKIHVWLVVILLLGLVSFISYRNVFYTQAPDRKVATVYVKDISLQAEVVNNPSVMERGLGNRTRLDPLSAMLFEFDEADKHGIWMKDMNFPIDVFWLDADYKVVHIVEELGVESYPNVFYPKTDAMYVVETNAGVASQYKISVGDTFRIVSSKSL